MCDILFSVAWQCGDRDCKAQWHKSSYWIDSDGYTCDNYSDGDHESVEESDLPSQQSVDESWREYSRYVLKHGIDPLEEFYVKHATKVRERWQFKFKRSIVGPVLVSARRAGEIYTWLSIPKHVKRYLHIKNSKWLQDFESWESFVAAVPKVKPYRWVTFHIDHDKPRQPTVVARDLRRLARKHLKNKCK